MRDVTIAIDETAIDFESALREGKISLAELSFLAQSDALSGLCTERWESKNGLARFCYSYPAFDLWIIHDIYRNPRWAAASGQNITLCEPGSDISFVYNELDQEDWGIEFSVEEASPSKITLSYTQSGGQQIGQLMTCGYEISRLDPMEPIARLDDAPLQEQMPISMDAKRQSYLGYRNILWYSPCRAVRNVPVPARHIQRRRHSAFNQKFPRYTMLLD